MLSHELDLKLDVIASGKNYEEIVFVLIDSLQAKGKLNELLQAAKRANPY